MRNRRLHRALLGATLPLLLAACAPAADPAHTVDPAIASQPDMAVVVDNTWSIPDNGSRTLLSEPGGFTGEIQVTNQGPDRIRIEVTYAHGGQRAPVFLEASQSINMDLAGAADVTVRDSDLAPNGSSGSFWRNP